MKSISLYTFILVALVKSIASFSCKNVYLDSKETLDKAMSVETVETVKVYTHGKEYNTWFINPCDSVENQPDSEKDKKKKCPSNSKVCLIKSVEFDGDKNDKQTIDIKAYAKSDPPQDPVIKQGDYILNFEGEEGYTAEISFTCAGNKGKPEVELDETNKKVSIRYKGICVSDNKTEPTDDDKKKGDNESSGGHFLLRFILIIIICYFVIGACYNFFVLNKQGIDVIPNVDLWITLFTACYDKITDLFGRRGYRPIQI